MNNCNVNKDTTLVSDFVDALYLSILQLSVGLIAETRMYPMTRINKVWILKMCVWGNHFWSKMKENIGQKKNEVYHVIPPVIVINN